MPVQDGWEVTTGGLRLKVGGVVVANLTTDGIMLAGDKTLTAPAIKKAGSAVAAGTQAAKINDPAGGVTNDANARTTINLIIDALEAFAISAPV